jgi:hypothetical protein
MRHPAGLGTTGGGPRVSAACAVIVPAHAVWYIK